VEVARNITSEELTSVLQFVENSEHTDVTIIDSEPTDVTIIDSEHTDVTITDAPHKFDLEATSCTLSSTRNM
jgi:hypothetical protein